MMLIETDFLIVKYEPAIGGLIRATLMEHEKFIAGKRQWQDGHKVCLVITLARPDTDDEGETTSFRYSTDEMIRQLEINGASVEEREKAA